MNPDLPLFAPQKVELLDSLGNDLTVVNAARVSFDKVSEMLSGQDEKLIQYLAVHQHWTPFSQVQYQVRITAPIFVARQFFKHMVGITRNEVSRRYVDGDPQFYKPEYFRERPSHLKQGSTDQPAQYNDTMMTMYEHEMNLARQNYITCINDGMCPEQARMFLPQSMMTSWVETGSLASAARIAHLRLDPHAQKEITELTQLFVDAIAPIAPVSWKALTENT